MSSPTILITLELLDLRGSPSESTTREVSPGKTLGEPPSAEWAPKDIECTGHDFKSFYVTEFSRGAGQEEPLT